MINSIIFDFIEENEEAIFFFVVFHGRQMRIFYFKIQAPYLKNSSLTTLE